MPSLPGPYASPFAYFGMLDQKRKEDVLKDVAEEAAILFQQYRDAIKEASALRELRASQRLQMYTERAPEIWRRLQSFFPQEYWDQRRDWYHLQRKIALAPHPSAAEATSTFGMRAASSLPSGYVPNGGLGA